MIYFRSRAHALRTRKVHVCVVVLRNHTSAQPHFRLFGPQNRDLISGESRIVNYLTRIDSVWVYWTYLVVSVVCVVGVVSVVCEFGVVSVVSVDGVVHVVSVVGIVGDDEDDELYLSV